MNEQLKFCPALAELVGRRTATGRSGRTFEHVAALSSLNNLLTLRNLMLELRPSRTLEIGLAFGGSSLVFTASHQDIGRTPTKQHTSIDPFQDTIWDNCGLVHIERAGLNEYLDFRPAISSLELPRLLSLGDRFDLAYIDGSHLFEDVFVDAYYVARLLEPNGIMLFDDSPDPHVRKVLRFLRSNCRLGLEEVDLSPFRSQLGGGLRYRAARCLGRAQMTAFKRVGSVTREWDSVLRQF